MKKGRILLVLLTLLVLLACGAAAESARVSTPGGGVKMRKKASTKGSLVTTVPNHALVEVEEAGEEWSLVRYKNRSGYVKSEFLLLPRDLPGKTVYPDGQTLLIREAPEEDAALAGVLNSQASVTVLEVENGWALVRNADGLIRGWTDAAELSWQRGEPLEETAWIPRYGTLVEACTLESGEAGTELPPGTLVEVTVIAEETCLVRAGSRWGTLSPGSVSLVGPSAAEEGLSGRTPEEAERLAWSALKREAGGAGNMDLYCVVGVDEGPGDGGTPLYHCGFCDERDRYCFGVLIDPSTGAVRFVGDYTAFAAPLKRVLLPEGQVTLTLSRETLAVGEVLEAEAAAWSYHAITWTLTGDAVPPLVGKPGLHFSAAFRPRQAGSYTLTVIVEDENGRQTTVSGSFTVEAGTENGIETIYSQKDGWWLDKAYRQSNLDRSGCAVFTLSHALQRLGFTGDDIRPERLARTYALCLTPDGTNNERLIREASAVYGYRTESEPITDKRRIVSLFGKGALFSFSVARGHIALVDGLSEDGTRVHVVDSAPGATWERKGDAAVWYRGRSGSFREAERLEDIPGARWYLDQDNWGGLEYWMSLDYAASRGLRLILPAE